MQVNFLNFFKRISLRIQQLAVVFNKIGSLGYSPPILGGVFLACEILLGHHFHRQQQ